MNAVYSIAWSSEYPSLLRHTLIFSHRIYRRKTKSAYTMFRAHALFHHIICFILEALRHWTNKNMYYYRTIKYLYCSLKPYFCGSMWFKRRPWISYERNNKRLLQDLSVNFVCIFRTKWWSINITFILTPYIFLWLWKEAKSCFGLH